MTIDQSKAEKRLNQRYPHTYACDWLCRCGLASSRSDASQLRQRFERDATEFAELYIHHEALQEIADKYLLEEMDKTRGEFKA